MWREFWLEPAGLSIQKGARFDAKCAEGEYTIKASPAFET
jgi:hypothetical protein